MAIVALPLALGFGVSYGLGAEAGWSPRIIAGALAALLGGSNLRVPGPFGAVTVVLVPIVAEYGPGRVCCFVGLMAGIDAGRADGAEGRQIYMSTCRACRQGFPPLAHHPA